MSENAHAGDIIQGSDGLDRCWWCGSHEDYVVYHDGQWGHPVADDRRLFEKICLEGFQSGLSWLTILRKRDNFRKAFCDFDLETVAGFDDRKIERLVQDAGIIRHRGKIRSAINNARQALSLREHHGSLAKFFWQFEPPKTQPVHRKDQVATTTIESTSMAKALKKAGWTFVGPTTCYAFMQSMGIVNDHLVACHAWQTIESARASFKRP